MDIGKCAYSSVGEMLGQDSGQAAADEVSEVAEGLPAALEDAGEGIILVGITEGHDGDDAVLDVGGELAGGEVGDLGTLAVKRIVEW